MRGHREMSPGLVSKKGGRGSGTGAVQHVRTGECVCGAEEKMSGKVREISEVGEKVQACGVLNRYTNSPTSERA